MFFPISDPPSKSNHKVGRGFIKVLLDKAGGCIEAEKDPRGEAEDDTREAERVPWGEAEGDREAEQVPQGEAEADKEAGQVPGYAAEGVKI